MIAKTRQGGSSGFQTTDLESSNAEHSALDVTDLREKDVGKKHSVVPDLKDLNKSELVPNPKFPEKTKVSQGLGPRGGLLTKKSTNALMPKRDSQKDVRAVEKRNKGVEKKVPNKVSIKEDENQNSEDFTDGRDPGEKKKEEVEQERSDRFYQLNKRLRQGDLKRKKVGGIQKTDSEYSSSLSSTISSTLISSNLNGTTISTATSSTYATTSSINDSTTQEERAKQKNSLGIMPNKTKQESKAEDVSSAIIGEQDDSPPCPEIPPGLQVRIQKTDMSYLVCM